MVQGSALDDRPRSSNPKNTALMGHDCKIGASSLIAAIAVKNEWAFQQPQTRFRASRSMRPVQKRKLNSSHFWSHMNPNTSRAVSVSAGFPE
jgi:hypothetical protein